jgi:DNA-binding transcriptional ArsR family regulator
MPNQQVVFNQATFNQATFNQVCHALADPTRRAVIERLSQGPSAVSELAAPFQMALPSFMQHLEVLSDCGLVRSTKTGRVRTFQLEPQPLQELEGWLLQQRNIWEQRLDQLDAYLLDLKKESEKPKN